MTTNNLIRIHDEGDTLQLGAFTLSKTGLVVDGKPSRADWEHCGVVLRRIEGAVQWWIGDWLNYGQKAYGEKYTEAVETTGIDQHRLENYSYVARKVPVSFRKENVSYTVHEAVAPLLPQHQRAILARAEREQLTVAQVRQEVRRLDWRRIEARPLPAGKYRVVYADPPWHYNDSGVIVEGDAYGRAERHYPTMTIDELCALPVSERVADDAVLFLWVTSPMLAECWPVISAWGFTYKTSIVWDKEAHNFGHYVSVRHELVLICTRGSCTPDCPTPMPPSVIRVPRSDTHSEKPQEVRRLIEQLYPHGARLELFARCDAPGWATFGNQRV